METLQLTHPILRLCTPNHLQDLKLSWIYQNMSLKHVWMVEKTYLKPLKGSCVSISTSRTVKILYLLPKLSFRSSCRTQKYDVGSRNLIRFCRESSETETKLQLNTPNGSNHQHIRKLRSSVTISGLNTLSELTEAPYKDDLKSKQDSYDNLMVGNDFWKSPVRKNDGNRSFWKLRKMNSCCQIIGIRSGSRTCRPIWSRRSVFASSPKLFQTDVYDYFEFVIKIVISTLNLMTCFYRHNPSVFRHGRDNTSPFRNWMDSIGIRGIKFCLEMVSRLSLPCKFLKNSFRER